MNRSFLFVTTLGSAIGAALLISSLATAADRLADDSRPAARPPVTPQDDGGIAGGTGNGPDVIVSDMCWNFNPNNGPLGSDISTYTAVGGIGAWSLRTVSCNLGEADAEWFANTADHPVIGQGLYRLKNNRFEQIGVSWLKHGFCAADSCTDPSPCGGATGAQCLAERNSSCDWLGTFNTDTYIASRNGTQSLLGPRSEVNPWTGVYAYPWINNGTTPVTTITKRMQAPVSDVNPSLNSGALYYGEVQYITTDEQPINRYNNVSYRQVFVGTATATSWRLTATSTDTTNQQQPAINAWRALDPTVVLTNIDVPNDGRLIIGCKVTDLGGGQWQYDYALYNMNCDRAVQSFGIPFETNVGIANIGFHDVSYHSGEPYSSVDWATSVGTSGVMSWETQTITENSNANALRWGTMYNFGFTAGAPPRCTTATLGLFKPGTPNTVTVVVPGPSNCVADIVPVGLGNGTVDVLDLLEVINRWGVCTVNTSTCGCPADIDPPGGNDAVDVLDLLKVINTWGGCP